MGYEIENMMNSNRPFNSPFEVGLRLLFILNASSPNASDLQRLVYYDYLLIHSGDIHNGPKSLHPPIPHRSCEWIIRRKIAYRGLLLMFSRELINIQFSNEGILYSAIDLTNNFIQLLKTEYATELNKRAKWINNEFLKYSDKQLALLMNLNVDKWGAEFIRESIVRDTKI